MMEELKVLQKLDHPNILYLYEIIDDKKKTNLCIVTEYYKNGSIGDLLNLKAS